MSMQLFKGMNIKPFARTVWLSARARELWESKIRAVSQAVQELELQSVEAGQRHCATLTIAPRDILKHEQKYPGLFFKAMRLTRRFQGFAHRHEDPGPNEDFYTYYLVAQDLQAARRFIEAHAAGDNVAQGELLGFPECCCKFFEHIWAEGYFDPIYQMGGWDRPHPYSNPLLRYIGVRIGFHIPCSFNCGPTIETAKERLTLLEDGDIKTLLEALLSMPMEWDCLHGAAQIKTPLFWIITSSVPCIERHVVRLPGAWIPKEGIWTERKKDDAGHS